LLYVFDESVVGIVMECGLWNEFLVCCVDERYNEASGVYGVIQSAQHSGRTCRVMWMRPQPSAESA